jgi:dTDP-3-amino-3,4,6-trideoxy-alpha-D-glucose transaminase
MMHSISQAAPTLRIARFRDNIDAAVHSVLDSQSYIRGTALETFEAAFAAHEGRLHAVGVGSGTDAIALALRALGVGPGDEVIVPALTFAGTAQAVLQCGAQPRFADVDPITRCLTVQTAEMAFTPRTAALVPVHLFGQPADMPGLTRLAKRRGLVVVADCAQSHGARLGDRRLGSFGDAAAYSFYPTKNLGCVGDGGAVLTDDPAIASRLRALREYGFEGGARISRSIGFNSRLDTIQAAILTALLGQLDGGNAERRALATHYRAVLVGADGLGLPPDDPGAVYHQFAITHAARDAVAARLAAAGIGTAVHYHPTLDRHPAFASVEHEVSPVAQRLADSLLSLPIQPEITAGRVEDIASALVEACAWARVRATRRCEGATQ